MPRSRAGDGPRPALEGVIMAESGKPTRSGASGLAATAAETARRPTLDRRALETLLRYASTSCAGTDVERAQYVMYDAWEADGAERVALAREALAISPLCADVYVLLAEETARSDEEATGLYRLGVEVGEKALGERFDELKGEFWGWLDTRPYMRARAGLAGALHRAGHVAQALDHWRALLELNPNDNQGIRYLLAFELLKGGGTDELRSLLGRYKDDQETVMAYTRALVAFRDRGLDAVALAEEACAANAHVPARLADRRRLPRSRDGYVTMGGADEAAWYVEEAGEAWRRTPGAVEWLLGVAAATVSDRRSR